jgi:hypothetical protein
MFSSDEADKGVPAASPDLLVIPEPGWNDEELRQWAHNMVRESMMAFSNKLILCSKCGRGDQEEVLVLCDNCNKVRINIATD